MRNDGKYIGKYRISYKGSETVAKIDKKGILYLPDGEQISLSKEQLKKIKDDLKAAEKEEAMIVPLAIPDIEDNSDEGKNNFLISFVLCLIASAVAMFRFVVLLKMGIIPIDILGL